MMLTNAITLDLAKDSLELLTALILENSSQILGYKTLVYIVYINMQL